MISPDLADDTQENMFKSGRKVSIFEAARKVSVPDLTDDTREFMLEAGRKGRLRGYGSQRRWIGLANGWTRIGGEGKTEGDARHSESARGESLVSDPEEEGLAVKALIAQLCEHMYYLGWARGTSGGLCIRIGGPLEDRAWRVFATPSGVQKEDMIADDVFELDMAGNVVAPPKTPHLRLSASTSLWYVVYKHRPKATAVLHTHDVNSTLVTLFDPTETSKTLDLTCLEMIKGVSGHAYDDVLEIPIIDNRPTEAELAPQMIEALLAYPKASAILVRRHGLYVWGDSWEQTKTHAESLSLLFECAVKMRMMGLTLSTKPHEAVGSLPQEEATRSSGPLPKRRRLDDDAKDD